MSITVQEVLDRFGSTLTESEFAAALAADLETLPRPDTAPLTSAERAFLTEHAGFAGAPLEPAGAGVDNWAMTAAARVVDLAAVSLTVQQAAARLGIDPSRVRHRVADRSLCGVRLGTRTRLPSWQFTDATPAQALPHLRALLAHTADTVPPIALATLMVTAQPDLRLGEAAVSPREWLLAGHDPGPVLRIVASPYQW